MGAYNDGLRAAARRIELEPEFRRMDSTVLVREVLWSFFDGMPKTALPDDKELWQAYAAAKAEVEKMKQEVWRLRNALVFYGNPRNYKRDQVVPNGPYVRLACRVDEEGGEQARTLVGDLIHEINRKSEG